MESIIHINKAGIPYAIICKNARTDGVRFFTDEQEEFQVGLMERPAGYQVEAHAHDRASRSVNGVSEFLYIETGKAKVSVFDEQWTPLASEVLEAGDFLLFLRGGHAVEYIEATRLIEVKQGPYVDSIITKAYQDLK